MNFDIYVSLVLFGVVQLVALIGAYYGLKADNASLAAKLALAMLAERSDRHAEAGTLKEHVMGLIVTVETSVSTLAHRIDTLEAGQDDWTKSLRVRTHELANQVNTLVLKVDRLERSPGVAGP